MQDGDGGVLAAPSRPFTMHSRVSSHSSIGSIVDEHGSSSPLNKAMETFTDANGEVAQDFVQKLKTLNSDNSKGDLCIEKCESASALSSLHCFTTDPDLFASFRRPREG